MAAKTSSVAIALLLLLSATAGVAPIGMAAGRAQGCSYPVSAVDATGERVTIESEPTRIVTLNPSAAQTLWEIGAKETVVGVSQYAGFLEGASELPVVTKGFPTTVQIEEVIALDPDLVLAPNTIPNETVQRLRRADIAVFRFHEASSIRDVYQKTLRIGRMAGACRGARETVAWMKRQIGRIREAVAGKERPSVIYPFSQGIAAGPDTFIGAMIHAAGGHNIVAEGNFTRAYPQLSQEFIVKQNPEWIVVSYTARTANRSARALAPDVQALRNTTAWEEGNFVRVNANNISQPAPRIVYPIRKMARAFHPEAYAEAMSTPTPSVTPTPAPTPTRTPSPTEGEVTGPSATTATETTTSGQPGFGVPIAVFGLASAAIALRRRQGV